MTNPKLLIRIASGLMLFFAFGHSMGHLTRRDVDDPKVTQVLQVMTDTQFDLFGHITNYDGMYNGLSLDLIFTLIVFTIILWHISNLGAENKKLAIKLLLPVTVCVLAFSITNFMFFFSIPAVTCLVAGLLLIVALIKLNG
jgi:hypothetical protein